MFDVLAIDWGKKRFGLAFADSSTELIITAKYDCNSENIFQILDSEIANRKVKLLVVGIPTNFQGKNTEITNKIQDFILELESKYPQLNIVAIDERQSTKDAKKTLENSRNKHAVNHQAAATILEYYFYSKRSS